MEKSHAGGLSSDPPTLAQLKEFLVQIKSGKITGERLHAFLGSKVDAPILSLTQSEQIAANILTCSKIAGYHAACQAWDVNPAESTPVIPFSEETLRQCANENERGADWRVAYIHGFSLRQQEKRRGRNRNKQPYFDPNYAWLLEKQQDIWSGQAIDAGYRLLDLSGSFGNMQWQVQEARIGILGENFERAEEQAVAEACFTFHLAGRNERLLKNFWHRGRLLAASNYHVRVGCFSEETGFVIGRCCDDDKDCTLRVVVSRKS